MTIRKRKGARRAAAPVVELIVRRTALRRFDKLKQAAAALPAVKVSWDRRTNDAIDAKPQTERRQRPPFTWDVADFVVVEKSPRAATSSRKHRT